MPPILPTMSLPPSSRKKNSAVLPRHMPPWCARRGRRAMRQERRECFAMGEEL